MSLMGAVEAVGVSAGTVAGWLGYRAWATSRRSARKPLAERVIERMAALDDTGRGSGRPKGVPATPSDDERKGDGSP